MLAVCGGHRPLTAALAAAVASPQVIALSAYDDAAGSRQPNLQLQARTGNSTLLSARHATRPSAVLAAGGGSSPQQSPTPLLLRLDLDGLATAARARNPADPDAWAWSSCDQADLDALSGRL